MMNNERSQQIGWGVFLIGLAILLLTDWFFPGIFFVVGIAMLMSDRAQGKKPMDNVAALAIMGIGLLFTTGEFFAMMEGFDWLPLVLIIGGGYLLFKDRADGDHGSTAKPEDSKPKNDYL